MAGRRRGGAQTIIILPFAFLRFENDRTPAGVRIRTRVRLPVRSAITTGHVRSIIWPGDELLFVITIIMRDVPPIAFALNRFPFNAQNANTPRTTGGRRRVNNRNRYLLGSYRRVSGVCIEGGPEGFPRNTIIKNCCF